MQLRVPHCGYRFRWSSLWGHEPCEGYAVMGWWCHADPLAGAFGGAPHGGHDPRKGHAAERRAELRRGPQCERGPWSLRWSSPWGRNPRAGCAELRRAPIEPAKRLRRARTGRSDVADGIAEISRNGLRLDVTRRGRPARLSARPWGADWVAQFSRNGPHLDAPRHG